ncbi:PREDICTED: mediator of RNA polymerase II transcription subunit 23-like [Camelina sativa]|uniref:Mediator of RNA polymerase II transcription subunit 23-like n=1 Tax=Camelina sativa TaxID=90675 RepID=A0ABM1QW99_CAMSA|nr:PREDICTED: mediator of RNA polymerase II transcription subunit 23-like [Camelina sativa]
MEQSQRTTTVAAATPSSSRSYQFHPARAAIIDLFNLYLGRGSRPKPDESLRDPPNKSQKRVHAPNRDLPPRNEQFILDFEQLQTQFNDPEQLRTITESVLIPLVVQCSNHAPRAEFLLFALRTLCRISYINWDTFLPSLLSSVSAAEASITQSAQAAAAAAGSSATSSQSLVPVSANAIASSSNYHSAYPTSLLPAAHGIGSPSPSGNEPGMSFPQVRSLENGQQMIARAGQSVRENAMRNSQRIRAAAINSLRQLSCKIILIGVEFNLKPVTHAEIFQYMMNWLVNWDKRDLGTEDSAGKSWRSEKTLAEWLRSCLDVIWLLVEEGVELVMTALNSDAKKVETTRKILSFHREDRNSDPNNPQSVLLDFVSSCQNLRIWSLSTTTRAYLNNEQLLKGKQIDEWWRSKGERMMDYMNMDDRSIGMFWVVSYTMAQPACETVINWLSSAGMAELPGLQPNDRVMMTQEVTPLPMSLLSGFSMNLCLKLALQMEEALFVSQVVPSIAMVETYTRLLLISPHSMFRSHFSQLAQRNASLLSKPGVTLLVLEILNYRLLPLYRYQGKSKTLMYDVTKIISALKGKRGDHRIFRLAENLCMNLILSLRDFFSVKREGKGPTEFTETLNRITIMTLAITIKTRGIADADHLVYLQTMLEQILATSQHTWSEKTMRHFPTLLRDTLVGRVDKRGLSIQAWQQAETTVINQCTQLLSPSAEPAYVVTYLGHSFPQHRQYLCAGACLLMQGHADNINSANLARVLREVSPEEVTANIYTLVDVLLHHIHVDLQQGQSLEAVLDKAGANLAFFFWTHEMLPLDIFLLALIDRDDDPHALIIAMSLLKTPDLLLRIKNYCQNRGSPEHWLITQVFKRNDLQKALGNHLSWKDRYPTFLDDIAARLLPVIPLVVYRLIENNAMEQADNLLLLHSHFLAYHPLRFTFVRDTLAYFYGHLPGKLVLRMLKVLDLSKIPFSESFPQYISPAGAAVCPPLDYFATLLLNLVNNVIPPLSSSSNCSSRSGSMADILNSSARPPHGKTPGTSQPGPANASEGQKAFYQIQDPGTYTQLVLETAVIEILSLPVSAAQIVSSLVQIIVNIQSTLIQSGNGFQGAANGVGQGSVLPTSPSGGSTDSMSAGRSTCLIPGINTASFVSRSGYTCQQLSCLLIQACGLLLAQLPPDFHTQLYSEASRVIRETWWLKDGTRSQGEIDSALGYALMDPTWAAQDNTSTAIGNTVALLHAFFSNLPQEWLDGTNNIITNLRPVTSVAMLRVVFRIMGPLLPRLANTHTLFNKTLALLLSALVDVFGKNAQTTAPVEASQIADLIDFLHHIIHYEGQGGAVQTNSKPRPDILVLIGRVADSLRPDVQHLLAHLKTDPNFSIYAAAHQNTAKTNTS